MTCSAINSETFLRYYSELGYHTCTYIFILPRACTLKPAILNLVSTVLTQSRPLK